ncbi:asparaginase [Mesorhizobium sp. PUT5]|uniref:asparaginase n=1 Tax=Mesorhizobium sp. PUT5 TaxID=3454629 RepID=UPI003FA42944
MAQKKVVVIATGGTIASRHVSDDGSSIADMSGEALLETLHGRPNGVEVIVDQFCNVGSYTLELPTIFDLAKRIESYVGRDDIDGVVVTHGTDTLEETAFLADLVVDTRKPMVFTGAQRSADIPDTDGPRNLADAIRLAASERAVGLGAIIVFEQDFHAARDVTKTHASRVDTFASGEHGKLGEVDEGDVIVFRAPTLRKTYRPQKLETRVDLIKLAVGVDDKFVRFSAQSGAKAIVLECFGRGNATLPVAKAVADIVAAGTPVIVTSRCTQGRVKPVYGNGGGADLMHAGAIFAGDLTGPKARILACVLLGAGLAAADMAAEFRVLAGDA